MKKNLWFFLLMILLLIGLSFCSKEEPISGDQVLGRAFFLTTDDVNYITCVSARSGGYIIDNVGGSGVWTSQGVCWSTTPNPTTADNKTIDGIYTDQTHFHSTLTGLNSGTTYYVRAYATNSAGITYYGNELHFSIPVARLPIVVTDTVVIISTPKEAQVGFNITDVGCAPITAKGVCWSTSQNPTINDNKVEESGPSLRVSHCHFAELEISTTYYLRAFATNSVGTAYGNEVSFTTPASFAPIIGSVTDVDGNTYKTIQIGTQTWMAENLKTINYNDGSQIPNVTGDADWIALKTGAYRCYNNDAATYKNLYGAMYNWYAVNAGKLCPTGWHVPSDDEWKQLEMALGMTQAEADSWGGEEYGDIGRGTDQGIQMKTTSGWIAWEGINGNGTNTSGFSGLPGGDTGWYGKFDLDGQCGSWWSSSQCDMFDAESAETSAVARVLGSGDGKVGRSYYYKHIGFSVRCLKNN